MRPFRYFADVSNNNPASDMATYRQAGHRLIGIKATEGETFIDPEHAARSRAAHEHGIRVLHYHFCRPNNHPHNSAEAAAFWRTARRVYAPGDLLCFDLEIPHPEGPTACGVYLSRLVAQLRNISGHSALGYSYDAFLESDITGEYLPGQRWWVAAFGHGAPNPGRGRRRWGWQFTDGVVGPYPRALPGVGKCDVSILNLRSALRLLLPSPQLRRANPRG